MKLVCISDTHGCHNYLEVPKGDVLIHCGDAELDGYSRYNSFMNWMHDQPHKHKLFIPGNHDFYMQQHTFNCVLEFEGLGIRTLIDKAIGIDGIKFYGAPWSPTFMNWAFMKDDQDLTPHWDAIPEDTDVLITHGPAFGIGDAVNGTKKPLGSRSLAIRILELKQLRMHLYGHIHTGTPDVGIAHNCSVLDEDYKLVHKARVIEIKKNKEVTIKG
jgi:Icc-related predicted phosphoesterase